MSQYAFEPARSYDFGTYLWSIGSKIDGPEMQDVVANYHSVDKVTAKLGFDRIEDSYDLYCKNAPISEGEYEPLAAFTEL